MAAFEDPAFALFSLGGQSGLLSLAPFNPAGLPVDLVDMNDWKPGPFA